MPTDAEWQHTYDLQKMYTDKLERWLASLGVDVHVDTFEEPPPVPAPPPVPTPVPTPVPPPTPTPVPTGKFPRLGACLINGGTLAAVASKWATSPTRPVIGRYFSGGNPSGIGAPPVDPAVMPSVIYSCKPDHVLSDAELIAVGQYLTEPNDLACTWHEPDVKWKKLSGAAADAALAQWLDITSKKNAAVARLRAAGKIKYDSIDIYGGWIFTDNIDDSKFVPAVRATYAGIDIDGTSGGSTYYNWGGTAVLAAINAFVKKHGYQPGWFATEYAWGAATGDKANGFAARIAAIKAQAPKILAAGCVSIIVYDYDNNPDEALRTPAEIAAMKAAVPA